jgi:hypothetical protein
VYSVQIDPMEASRMKHRQMIGVAVLLAVAVALSTGAALAGGWATVTLDEPPGEVVAGEPQTIGFRVWQHGQTPVHFLGGDNWPVEPVLVATHSATGERVEATAVRAEEVGRFTVEVTFPSDGAWEWEIRPEPLMLEGSLPPLTVLPAAAPAPEPQPVPASVWLSVAAAALGIAAFGLWAGRRTDAARPAVEQ